MRTPENGRTAYCIISPKGMVMITTISSSRAGAKKKILDVSERRYSGLVERNFEKWKIQGYKLGRVRMSLISCRE